MAGQIKVVECGSKVVCMDITGTITAFEVRFSNVVYEFTYFYDGDFKTKWISKEQFNSFDLKTASIGFISNGKEQ